MQSGAQTNKSACPQPELIRACEENVLPEEMADRVRTHLASCPVCGMLQRDIVGFDPVGPSAVQLRRMRSAIPPAQVASKERQGIRWWPAWAFASAVAIVFVLAMLTRRVEAPQPKTPQQATAQPQKKFEIAVAKAPIEISSSLLVTRGPAAEQPSLDEWTLALRPYKEDDSVGAIRAIGEVTQKYPHFADGYFYLGVTQLLAGRNGDAVTSLEQASHLPSDRKIESQWYLGAAYAKAGRYGQAATVWRGVCTSKSSFSHQACEAIQRLNSTNLH